MVMTLVLSPYKISIERERDRTQRNKVILSGFTICSEFCWRYQDAVRAFVPSGGISTSRVNETILSYIKEKNTEKISKNREKQLAWYHERDFMGKFDFKGRSPSAPRKGR